MVALCLHLVGTICVLKLFQSPEPLCMRPVDVHAGAVSVRVSQAPTIETSSLKRSRNALSHIWMLVALHPATVFVFFSLAFGFLVSFVTPPLRGPDEISHFLRIYAYARGELLPAAEDSGAVDVLPSAELLRSRTLFHALLSRIARKCGERHGDHSTLRPLLSVFAVGSAMSSSSQRRPRAIDATRSARFSERIGRDS